MPGIPPTGIQGVTGATVGLGVSDPAKSVEFYNIIFTALGGVRHATDSGVTWWGNMLVIHKAQRPTQNAAVYISAPAFTDLAAVVTALKAKFPGLQVVQGTAPGPPRKTWRRFPDPDGNIVWVTYTSPHP